MKKDTWITEEFKIKGMICSRCLKVLSVELKATGAEVMEIELGRVVIRYDSSKLARAVIDRIILDNDFQIISDKATLLAEQTKLWIINFVWSANLRGNLSEYLADKLGANYRKLSKNFSGVQGRTIERYALLLKVERAKELLEHDRMNISEIAYLLGYENVSALSRQFKRETGMTLTQYGEIENSGRIPLDKI